MQPKRIVSMLASGTEILYALGLGERVVAVSHECDYPADATHKPRVTVTRVAAEAASRAIDEQVRSLYTSGAALYEVNVPLLEELRPDMIVTQAQCDVCAVRYQDVLDAVESSRILHDVRVVALNPNRLSDVFRDILQVGDTAEAFDRAKTLTTGLRLRVELIRQRTSTLPLNSLPRVVCVEWIEPLMVAANWTPELIELAGGKYALATEGAHTSYTQWEEVLEYAPEVIVIAPCGFDLARSLAEAPTLQDLPEWDRLPAVRDNRVFVCDGNAYFNRSGPRLVDTLELLAHFIHPQHFGPPACCTSPGVWQALAPKNS